MTSTAERMREWTGSAILSFGFRPFFFMAGLWAALAMILWIMLLSGYAVLPTAFDPVSWHAHEFLFGYLAAVMAGFLLTAVPNWTGGLPVTGWPLGGLAALWLLGRIAVAVSAHLTPISVALIDLSMPVVLAAAMGREIVAGKNWQNLPVMGLLTLYIGANVLFHTEAATGNYAADGTGERLGLAAAIMLIALVGGRIVPSFTRNWLVRRADTTLPAPPMQRFDKLALVILAAALILWIAAPLTRAAGLALALAGVLHLVRLAHWAGHRCTAEPLVWVLHVGYAFIPLGALAVAAAILMPAGPGAVTAQHLWTAGAVGVMTLAVMTRATLGHTGQALSAGPGTLALYLLAILAVLTRAVAGMFVANAAWIYALSGLCWIGAFGGFAALYGPVLLHRRPG